VIGPILTTGRKAALRLAMVRVGASGLGPELFAQLVALILAASGREVPRRFRLSDGEDVKAEISEIKAALTRIEERLDERSKPDA
jgi:hypothetical protein